MKNEFGKDFGLVSEVIITGRKVGATESFWAALAHNEGLLARVVAFVSAIVYPVFQLKCRFEKADLFDESQLVSDSVDAGGNFHPKLSGSIKGSYETGEPLSRQVIQEDDFVENGSVLLQYAEKLTSCGGQRHAEAMQQAQEFIPVEWRDHVLVFPATRWSEDEKGDITHVPTLRWSVVVEKWELSYYSTNSFLRGFRIVQVENA